MPPRRARDLRSPPPMRIRFDRGTQLLQDPPDNIDTLGITGLLWDSRVEACRAPAYLHQSLRKAIFQQGIPLNAEVVPSIVPPLPWKSLDLRPYQEAAWSSWNAAGGRGVIVRPSGGGRTRIPCSSPSSEPSPSSCTEAPGGARRAMRSRAAPFTIPASFMFWTAGARRFSASPLPKHPPSWREISERSWRISILSHGCSKMRLRIHRADLWIPEPASVWPPRTG